MQSVGADRWLLVAQYRQLCDADALEGWELEAVSLRKANIGREVLFLLACEQIRRGNNVSLLGAQSRGFP